VKLEPKQSIFFKELKPEVLHKSQPNIFYFILFTGEISPISEITN
jgi:hypothetical protein